MSSYDPAIGWPLIWLCGLSLIWLPGALLQRALRLSTGTDWLVSFAVQLGLGLALWPIVLLWTTLAGWHWLAPAAQVTVLTVVLGGFGVLVWPRFSWAWRQAHFQRQAVRLAIFLVVIIVTGVTRVLHVRNLVLPPWVDSVHHVAIARLLIEQGAVPATFAPFIPDGILNYHWGFHALIAVLAWLMGTSDAFHVADITLHFGQLLNVLMVVMLYTAGRVLFASQRAGLLIAAIGGVVSWFPAYYISWGRYTHLAGILIAVPSVLTLWRLRAGIRTGKLIAVMLLLAGLALVHVRIAFLTAFLVGLLAAILLVQHRPRTLWWWFVVAAGASLITLPWWVRLLQSTWVRSMVAVRVEASANWMAFNQPDWRLVWTPNNDLLIDLATAGLSSALRLHSDEQLRQLMGGAGMVFCLIIGIWSWRRARLHNVTSRFVAAWLLLASWVLVTALLLQSERLGLPSTRFIHINVGIITLFVPISLTAGGVVAWAQGVLTPRRVSLYLAGLITVTITLFGANTMVDMVNPVTMLAGSADRAALTWVRRHTPADARFFINVRPWLGDIYAGIDGGYWLPVLADRATILPPALYSAALPGAASANLNAQLNRLSSVTNVDDPAFRAELAAHNVTHIYIGENAGTLTAEQVDRSAGVALIYRRNGVSIYRIDLTQ